MTDVFTNDICSNSTKNYFYDYLNIYCIKEGDYLYINKEIYK